MFRKITGSLRNRFTRSQPHNDLASSDGITRFLGSQFDSRTATVEIQDLEAIFAWLTQNYNPARDKDIFVRLLALISTKILSNNRNNINTSYLQLFIKIVTSKTVLSKLPQDEFRSVTGIMIEKLGYVEIYKAYEIIDVIFSIGNYIHIDKFIEISKERFGQNSIISDKNLIFYLNMVRINRDFLNLFELESSNLSDTNITEILLKLNPDLVKKCDSTDELNQIAIQANDHCLYVHVENLAQRGFEITCRFKDYPSFSVKIGGSKISSEDIDKYLGHILLVTLNKTTKSFERYYTKKAFLKMTSAGYQTDSSVPLTIITKDFVFNNLAVFLSSKDLLALAFTCRFFAGFYGKFHESIYGIPEAVFKSANLTNIIGKFDANHKYDVRFEKLYKQIVELTENKTAAESKLLEEKFKEFCETPYTFENLKTIIDEVKTRKANGKTLVDLPLPQLIGAMEKLLDTVAQQQGAVVVDEGPVTWMMRNCYGENKEAASQIGL